MALAVIRQDPPSLAHRTEYGEKIIDPMDGQMCLLPGDAACGRTAEGVLFFDAALYHLRDARAQRSGSSTRDPGCRVAFATRRPSPRHSKNRTSARPTGRSTLKTRDGNIGLSAYDHAIVLRGGPSQRTPDGHFGEIDRSKKITDP